MEWAVSLTASDRVPNVMDQLGNAGKYRDEPWPRLPDRCFRFLEFLAELVCNWNVQ